MLFFIITTEREGIVIMVFEKLHKDIGNIFRFLGVEIDSHELKGLTLVVVCIIVITLAGLISDLLWHCGCPIIAEIAFYLINVAGSIYCYYEAKKFFKVDA